MNELTTIIQPVVTEKATELAGKGHYMFFVKKTATKVDIKKAVEKTYGTKVGEVKIMITYPKVRLVAGRRELIKKASAKKAIVTLKKGEKVIDVNKIKFKEKK